MPISIDLRQAHLVRTHGDITAVYTWVDDERAMVLVPHRRAGASWYVVMEGAAHVWDEDHDVRRVAAKALHACSVLGIEQTPTNAHRIARIICEGLPDLIRMPSAPPPQLRGIRLGEMRARADGQDFSAEDLILQPEGATYAA